MAMDPETSNTAKPLPPVEILREYLDYDPETGIVRWKKKPARNVEVGDEVGSYYEYRRVSVKGSGYPVHRLIWKLVTGDDPGVFEIDHINGVRDDNRWCNLRLADRCKNAQNVRPKGNVGCVGVNWIPRLCMYSAGVTRRGVRHLLGRYLKFQDAADAVRRKVIELDGCFPSRRVDTSEETRLLRADLDRQAAERAARIGSYEERKLLAKQRKIAALEDRIAWWKEYNWLDKVRELEKALADIKEV